MFSFFPDIYSRVEFQDHMIFLGFDIEKLVQSFGQEDPLEEGRATHSSIPAWRIPWTENPGVLQSMGSQRDCSDFAQRCDISTLVF